MPRTNYKDIHDAIKNKIVEYEFEYRDASQWFNLEAGEEIPQGLPGKAFNIQFGDQNPTDIDAKTISTNIIIEFLLDAKKDDYVRHIGFCQEAVEAIENIEIGEIDIRIRPTRGEGLAIFNRIFVVDEKVVLTFDSLAIIMKIFK